MGLLVTSSTKSTMRGACRAWTASPAPWPPRIPAELGGRPAATAYSSAVSRSTARCMSAALGRVPMPGPGGRTPWLATPY